MGRRSAVLHRPRKTDANCANTDEPTSLGEMEKGDRTSKLNREWVRQLTKKNVAFRLSRTLQNRLSLRTAFTYVMMIYFIFRRIKHQTQKDKRFINFARTVWLNLQVKFFSKHEPFQKQQKNEHETTKRANWLLKNLALKKKNQKT